MKARQAAENDRKSARLRGRPVDRSDPRYEPTKADLEEDMRIDCTPEELTGALFGRHPRRVVH